MKFSTLALIGIAAAFAAAEIAHPTAVVPKKLASRALLIASQRALSPRPNTLGPELLDDLPRIWPNAPAQLGARDAGARMRLDGRIADPYTHLPGAAVFPIVDGKRLARFFASYVGARYTLEFSCGRPGSSLRTPVEVAVGMVAADQRGFFHSVPTLRVDSCAS